MNDPHLTLNQASIWAQIETQHQARTALAHDVLGANKTSLFDALMPEPRPAPRLVGDAL